ncbi:MAG: hypothetical protein K2Q22_05650 [Cytophagales bacterium]|nr:hypothetical protein [Cytophagales bacterium]
MKTKRDVNSITKKLISIVFVLISLFVGIIAYSIYQKLGFPDGHLTTFERLSKSTLYPVFFIFNTSFIFAFGWGIFKEKLVFNVLLLYLLLLILFVTAYYYFSIHVENGQAY